MDEEEIDAARRAAFSDFVAAGEPRLRRALVGALGAERGRDATLAALGYAWANWDRVRGMAHPVAYLYRVGQSQTRPRRRRVLHDPVAAMEPWVEPGLRAALSDLSARQRCAVVLIHGFDWPVGDVAELLGVSENTTRTHLKRGLDRLRAALEVHDA